MDYNSIVTRRFYGGIELHARGMFTHLIGLRERTIFKHHLLARRGARRLTGEKKRKEKGAQLFFF